MKHPIFQLSLKAPCDKKYRPKKVSTLLKHYFAKRANSQKWQNHELELFGIIDMVEGLEYHARNFVKIEKKCSVIYNKIFDERSFYSVPSKNAIHEMTAYLNRMGQILALFTSDWFKESVGENDLAFLCPTILALIPFRNKFASHRSLDQPRKETSSQKANHASMPFGLRWMGTASSDSDLYTWDMNSNIAYQIKISKNEPLNRSKILVSHHPLRVDGIEIFVEEEIWITFIPVKNHDIICNEIFNVIQRFFASKDI